MLKYSKSCEGAEDLQEALSSILGILKAVNDSMHLIAITGYDVRTAEGAPTFVPQLSGGANEPAWWGDLARSGLGPAPCQCRATPLSFHVRACHLESIEPQSASRVGAGLHEGSPTGRENREVFTPWRYISEDLFIPGLFLSQHHSGSGCKSVFSDAARRLTMCNKWA